MPALRVNRERLKATAVLWTQIVSLVATGWLVWITSLVPRLSRKPLDVILGEAIAYALLAWGWSAAIALCLYLSIPKAGRRAAFPLVLRTSATAVWFAPATILLSQMSPAALVAALAFVVGTTRLLYLQWRATHPPMDPPARPPAGLLQLPPARWIWKQLLPGVTTAVAFQAAVVAVMGGFPLLAAALFALCVAMLTLLAIVTGAYVPGPSKGLPGSVFGVLLTLLLAAGLTVGGLIGSLEMRPLSRWDIGSHPRPNAVRSVRALLRAVFYGEGREERRLVVTRLKRPSPPEVGKVDVTDATFQGVILSSETKPDVTLVAPLPAGRGLSLQVALPNPMTIPFSGEYWMFKPPYQSPPKKSFKRRGTPLQLSFMTTDHLALFMEAHQVLPHAIDLSCCSKLQIAVLSTDRYPGTVSLEVILIDSVSGQPRSKSIGGANVISVAGIREESAEPLPQVLNFSIPRNGTLRQFNEIRVIFHRSWRRIDRSAKVSIERFVLIPHGAHV